MKVGIISDTHGLLRPEVAEVLKDCEVILHAGDINKQEILDELEKTAPVHVVRGNNDKAWAEHIPYTKEIDIDGCRVFMTHKKSDIPADTSGYDLVVFGHSHKYTHYTEGDTVFLNPGSCGPRRFTQPITFATAEIGKEGIKILKIDVPHPVKKTK